MKKQKGFILIELLVVIAVIGMITSIALVAFGTARGQGRDARRVQDMEQIIKALSLYYDTNGSYPPINGTSVGFGGWNVSYMDGFLSELTPNFIASSPKDPINQFEVGFSAFGPKAGSYFYAYYNYPASSTPNYNCSFNSDFSILAVRQLESGPKPDTPKAQCGTIPAEGCPGGGVLGVCRDWSTEFDYAVMLIK